MRLPEIPAETHNSPGLKRMHFLRVMRGAAIVDPDLTFTSRPQFDLSELAE
jgi:hypothetical protein